MARAQGARALMALAFETTYGLPSAGDISKMPFASATLGAGLGLRADPAGNAVKAVLGKSVLTGEMLERKQAPPLIIEKELGRPFL